MERVIVALCLLGLCSLGLGNESRFPVEDDDSSADDEDFSGSGMEDIIDRSSSVTTVGPVAVPEPTEPDVRNVTLVGVESTTKYKDTAKQHEEVLEKMDPTAEETIKTEAGTPTSTAHLTASSTTAEDLDVHWHLHQGRHHHKATSPSMVEDPTRGLLDESHHVHHIPLAEATTSPPSDDDDLINHGITTTGPVKGGGIHHEVPVGTPSADDDKTTEPTEVNEVPVFVGLDEKQTTKVPLVDDSDKSEDHVPTTSPPHGVEMVEGGGHHIAVTTSPPLDEEATEGIVKTTALTHDEDSKIDQVTTPADVNKHHHHHHHPHHPHHHNHTTVHITDSTLEPMDKFAPDPTDVEDEVKPEEEFTDMPEDHLAESSTHSPDDQQPFTSAFPALYEIDTDFPESKEDEESGDDTANKDLFFETNVVGVEGAKEGNERNAAIDNGSSDASHGIMERKELLAGIIAGGAVGLIFAAFLVGFVLYRMKKKDEGSYSLEEPKQSNGGYQKPREQREFYA